MTAARRIARLGGTILLVAAMLPALALLVPSLLGYERYIITGGSMSGAFEVGSIAYERAVPVEDLVVGDVITYMPPADAGFNQLVTHRIIEITEAENGGPLFLTQGDANADPDPWTFQLDQPVQPVVEFTAPLLGYAFIALANPLIRMVVIGLPLTVIALLELKKLVAIFRDTPSTVTAADAEVATA
jgi:signal peptidase I